MTLDFDRFLLRKMATIFIENTRRRYGYACVFLFDIDHFFQTILPVKPKRQEYRCITENNQNLWISPG